jgi:hypothetical protein
MIVRITEYASIIPVKSELEEMRRKQFICSSANIRVEQFD